MSTKFEYFCAIVNKTVLPGPDIPLISVPVAVCVRLSGTFQNNPGLAQSLELLSLEEVRAQPNPPILEIERSYSSAARRGVFVKLSFEIVTKTGSTPDPTIGRSHRTTVVYPQTLSAVAAAAIVTNHRWTFGNNPAHEYVTVLGSVVEKKSKGTTPTFA